jgi:hypothetical protein
MLDIATQNEPAPPDSLTQHHEGENPYALVKLVQGEALL